MEPVMFSFTQAVNRTAETMANRKLEDGKVIAERSPVERVADLERHILKLQGQLAKAEARGDGYKSAALLELIDEKQAIVIGLKKATQQRLIGTAETLNREAKAKAQAERDANDVARRMAITRA